MIRECTRCHRSFTPPDLLREESRNMESERKAAGLEGVRFLYYHCPACQMNDIFVDILPLPEEPADDFWQRRNEREKVVRQLDAEEEEAVVVAVSRSGNRSQNARSGKTPGRRCRRVAATRQRSALGHALR